MCVCVWERDRDDDDEESKRRKLLGSTENLNRLNEHRSSGEETIAGFSEKVAARLGYGCTSLEWAAK